MGKSKKRSRASKARLNPIGGGKDAKSKDDVQATKKVQPLLEKLHSAVPNDRAMALGTLSVLCEDANMRKVLLKEKLVQIILSKLLTDNNTDIVVESFGLLRNLSLEEGYDLSIHLWRSDIWTSVDQGFDKLIKSLAALQATEQQENNNKNSSESRRLLFDYADNLLSLVVALGNGAVEILQQLLEPPKLERLFEVITRLIQYGTTKLPLTVLNTILDLLYDFSSESFEFIEAVANNSFLSAFVKSLPEQMNTPTFNELTKVLVQGIYLQFLDMDITYQQANEIIHSVCDSVKGIDFEQVKTDLSAESYDEEIAQAKDAQVAQKIKNYTKVRTAAMMKLQSIEIAIDLITAVTEIIASSYEEKKQALPTSLVETITIYLPQIFLHLSRDFSSRILIAWNNMLWLYLTLGINLFELEGELYKTLWEFVNSADETELDIKLGKLSVTWALLKTTALQSDSAKWLSVFQLANNQSFASSLIENYKRDMTDENLAAENSIELGQRYCGVLSTYASFQHQIQVNELVGKFIIEQLCSAKLPAALLADFTDSLFEIYGDETFDYNKPVFVQCGFLEVLETRVLSNLKAQFKFVDRNKDPQLKERCNECFNNLEGFIHYKKNE